MAVYFPTDNLQFEKVKIYLNGQSYKINLSIEAPSVNEYVLIDKNGYILLDSEGYYLLPII